MNTTESIWIVVLVGALSGVAGAIIGPVIQRIFQRNDIAIDARQAWVKSKLQEVFGVGDHEPTSEMPNVPFTRFVPPNGEAKCLHNSHDFDWAVGESPDLAILQPRRSAWSEAWLRGWVVTLSREFSLLHAWMHYNENQAVSSDPHFERADGGYLRRVRRVKSALALWGTGQWLTNPGWRLRLSVSRLGAAVRNRPTKTDRLVPPGVRTGEYLQHCT